MWDFETRFSPFCTRGEENVGLVLSSEKEIAGNNEHQNGLHTSDV